MSRIGIQKRIYEMVVATALFGISSVIFAQPYAETKKEKTEKKDGMTTIHVTNGHQITVPEGLKVEKVGAQIRMQDPTEFVMEKLQVVEERLVALEKKQDELEADLTILQEVISSMGKWYDLTTQIKKKQEQSQAELMSLKESLKAVKERLLSVQGKEPAPAFSDAQSP